MKIFFSPSIYSFIWMSFSRQKNHFLSPDRWKRTQTFQPMRLHSKIWVFFPLLMFLPANWKLTAKDKANRFFFHLDNFFREKIYPWIRCVLPVCTRSSKEEKKSELVDRCNCRLVFSFLSSRCQRKIRSFCKIFFLSLFHGAYCC